MKAVIYILILLWLSHVVRVVLWLYRSDERMDRLPREARRDAVRLISKGAKAELDDADRRFFEAFRRRFLIEFYGLIAAPLLLLGIGLLAHALTDAPL